MPKAAFYGVQKGKTPGVYSTWAECEEQTKGFKGAVYKKFGTTADAEAFVSSTIDPTKPYTASKPKSTNNFKPPSPKDTQPKIKKGQMPAHSKAQSQGYTISDEGNLVVYCDGSSRGNGKVGAKAGLGVYWGSRGLANDRNIAEPLPGLLQTNNRGELLAIVRAIESNPFPDLTLEIRTDSQYSIQCLTQWLPSWLKRGFKTASGDPVKNHDIIVHLWVLLQRAGMRKVRFTYVKGHAGHYGNEEADRLANEGAAMPYPGEKTDWLTLEDLNKPLPTNINGSGIGNVNGHSKTNGHGGSSNGNGKNGHIPPQAQDGYDPLGELGVEIDIDPNLQMFAAEEEYDF